jgi:hypothetical protein
MEQKFALLLLVYATAIAGGALVLSLPANAFYKKYWKKDTYFHIYQLVTGHAPSVSQVSKCQRALVLLAVVFAYTCFLMALLLMAR